MEPERIGPFLVKKRIGSRRGERVYVAFQEAQQRKVLLRFLRLPRKLPKADAIEKVQQEVGLLKKLRHPNLQRVLGAGVHEDAIFLAYEHQGGEQLSAILSRRQRLPADLVVEYGRQIADMTRYLHQCKMTHASLTPGNLLVQLDHTVQLSGVRLSKEKLRRWDARKRTDPELAAYLAPEHFEQGSSLRGDLYSIGVILFEMLAGRLPFDPDTISRMAKKKREVTPPNVIEEVLDCPVWLGDLVTRLLQPNAKKRPYSSNEVCLAFEEIRRVDKESAGAAAEIAGTFNAINAGIDKSTAALLLGTGPRESEASTTLLPSIVFLVVGLLMMVGMGVWMAQPVSPEKLLEENRQRLESKDLQKWFAVTHAMKPLMESDSEFADDATRLYFDAKRKLLLDLASRGTRGAALHSIEVQQFCRAYQDEQDGNIEAAASQYRTLMQSLHGNDQHQHVFELAKERLAGLASEVVLPESPEALLELIQKMLLASSPQELQLAKRVLGKIYLENAGEPNRERIASLAEKALSVVDERQQRANGASEPKDGGQPNPDPTGNEE